jgi:hypothetical protein
MTLHDTSLTIIPPINHSNQFYLPYRYYLKMPRNDLLTNGATGYNSGGVNMGLYGGAAAAGVTASRLQQAPTTTTTTTAAAAAGAPAMALPSSVAAPATARQ